MSRRVQGDRPRSDPNADPNAHLSPADLFLERLATLHKAIRVLRERNMDLDHRDARTLQIWLEELQASHKAAVAKAGGPEPC